MKALIIDAQKIAANAAAVLKRAEKAAVYAVLKGDAYGMGIVETAKILRAVGITRFAVTETEEAAQLRNAGFTQEEILFLRSTTDAEEIEKLIDLGLVATISSHDSAVALNGIAQNRGTVIEAHIKIDTGMGRYGFLPSEQDKAASLYKYMPGIALTGIYTHFHSAFRSEKAVRAQFEAFTGVIKYLEEQGIDVGIKHCANSSALFRYPFTRLDAVRVGSAFTGRLSGKHSYGLSRVGFIESAVSEVRWLPRGHTIGYGAGYKTRRPTKIAIIPVGFADGFCTEKSPDTFTFFNTIRICLSYVKKWLTRKRLYVRLGNARARVLGHVAMLSTVIDVTKLDCAPGDRVTLGTSMFFTSSLERVYPEAGSGRLNE